MKRVIKIKNIIHILAVLAVWPQTLEEYLLQYQSMVSYTEVSALSKYGVIHRGKCLISMVSYTEASAALTFVLKESCEDEHAYN